MKKETKLLRKQMELLNRKSEECEPQDLSMLTKDMVNVNAALRNNAARKDNGGYDGTIRIKTKVDNSAINKTMKKLKKASALADELAKKLD